MRPTGANVPARDRRQRGVRCQALRYDRLLLPQRPTAPALAARDHLDPLRASTLTITRMSARISLRSRRADLRAVRVHHHGARTSRSGAAKQCGGSATLTSHMSSFEFQTAERRTRSKTALYAPQSWLNRDFRPGFQRASKESQSGAQRSNRIIDSARRDAATSGNLSVWSTSLTPLGLAGGGVIEALTAAALLPLVA
jgi:hypothetical protein